MKILTNTKKYALHIILSIIALNLSVLSYKQFYPTRLGNAQVGYMSPYRMVSSQSQEPMKVHIESVDAYAFNFLEVPVRVKNSALSIETSYGQPLSVRVENTPLSVKEDNTPLPVRIENRSLSVRVENR